MIVKSKVATIYTYGVQYQCWITCFPQQKWKATYKTPDEDIVILSRGRVKIELPRKDFEKNWIAV